LIVDIVMYDWVASPEKRLPTLAPPLRGALTVRDPADDHRVIRGSSP
jgi:hypothetical protein